MKTNNLKIETVTDGIVSAIISNGDPIQAIFGTVANMLARTVKEARKVGAPITDAIANVATGAVHGAAHLGADLGHTGKGLVLGLMYGTKEMEVEAIRAIGHAAEIAVKATVDVGGDIQTTVTGMVEGAIEGAKRHGFRTDETERAVSDGALKGAREFGPTAIATVHAGIQYAFRRAQAQLNQTVPVQAG